MGDANAFLNVARRSRPTDLAPGEAAFHDDRGVRVVLRSRAGDCGCTPGFVCRQNGNCPRGACRRRDDDA